MKLLFKTLGVLAGLGLPLLPGHLYAQNYDSPGLGQQPVTTHPQDYKPLGIRAGSFMLHPGVHLAAQFSDNALYSSDNEQDDTVFHIRPYINAQSTWNKHSLNVSLSADIGRYKDFDFRDYEDYMLTIDGRVDVKNRSSFSYGLNYLDLHEDLNSRDSEQGFEPTQYSIHGGRIGYDHTFNRMSLEATYSINWTDFDNALALGDGVIDNQDRDRKVQLFKLRAGYQFKTDMQAFVSYAAHKTDYDESLDRNGLDRSGDSYKLSGGLQFNLTGKLNGDVFASYHEAKINDPLLPDISGWAAGAGLQWSPTQLTSVYGKISSSIEATTSKFNSGYLRTLYSLRVDHELTRSVQLSGFASYSDNDYQLIDNAPVGARSNDEIWRTGVGVNWFINRNIFLNASYDYEKLKSNLANDDYKVNNIWLLLGFER